MKKIISYFSMALSVLLTCSMFSCSSDDIFEDLELDENNKKAKTCELVLNVEKVSFDEENPTRSVTRSVTNWENGDKIYLTFSNTSGTSYGDAIYNGGTWTVNYYGSLTEGVASKCSAVYFDNFNYESSSVIQLTENTGIYEDLNGQYIFNDGTLSVTATLSPKTGRIRFASTSSDSVTIYGISHYTSYDVSNGEYISSTGALKVKPNAGYTPYIYGEFSDLEQPRLNIITTNSGYTRLFPTSVFKKGESGFLNVPTVSSHNGWQNSVILKVNGVEFTMIPVEYTAGFFLLAETETTEQLYNAIIGSTATTSKLPKRNISYSNWSTFISKLKATTELNFYIPSREEWQHAYKGGEKSQNSTYSGSNIISNVAWYEGNSEGKVHDVKLLQPNELGFYDMSGNVFEFTSYYSSYYDEYYYYGGYYGSNESNCLYNTGNSERTAYATSVAGLRFALKP